MFDFLNQPGIIKFSQGPFQYIWHAHGFSVQDYLTLSNDSVFQLPFFISNVPLPNYIHLFQIFRGVCKYFLTAVNLSFSLRTLAKSIPLFETRLDFCSATGSPSTTLFRLRTDCVVLTYLFYWGLFQVSFWSVTTNLSKTKISFFRSNPLKSKTLSFKKDSVIAQFLFA